MASGGRQVTILCQSRLFFPLTPLPRLLLPPIRNHPLSIEAIFPTPGSLDQIGRDLVVTILCQSRLFFPHPEVRAADAQPTGNHPLSIEAIFPTVVDSEILGQHLL